MRLLVVVVALLMLVPWPGGAAQTPGAILSDPVDDVRSEVQGNAAPGASDVYSSLDLAGYAVEETVSDLTFTVTLADLRPTGQETAADGLVFETRFDHNGRAFLLAIDQILPHLIPLWRAGLSMRDTPDSPWTSVWASGEVRADPEADTLQVTLDRNLLADKDGASPFPGRALEGLRVRASTFLSNSSIFAAGVPTPTGTVKVLDDMPDLGQAAGRYDIAIGVQQSGHARLFSDVPYRASNGEATTFLFSASARNLADRDDTFEFEAVGAPARLAVTTPVTVASIPAGGALDIPVLATIPFAHIHGGVDEFTLEMRSTSDPGSVGRIAMGIRYLTIPQPAGHHDAVYLHSSTVEGLSSSLFQDGYMNTLAEDPSDTKQPIPSSGLSINGDSFTHQWYFMLEPALQMGLDLDLSRLGRIAIPIGSPVLPIVATTLEARVATGPRFSPDAIEVAHLAPIGPVEIMPQSTYLFEGDLVPSPDADRLPFEPGTNLYLEVFLTTKTPSLILAEQPFVAPGGHFQLPLFEYHDPVDDALKLLDGPGLSPLGAQERLVNPGKAIVFPFSLANPADDDRSYHIEVSGTNAEWASLPSNHVRVPAHGTASGSLVVRAPPGTSDGDRADLILQAYDTANPASRGLLRLLTEVDTDAQHPDDTAVADDLSKAKESPGVAPAMGAGCLALAALVLRRRGPGPRTAG